MGYTNLQAALLRKYRSWLSEKRVLDKQIEAIEKAKATLKEKQGRADRVQLLLDSVKIIMSEVAPSWDSDEVKPAQHHTTSLPFEPSEITRWSLEAMRESETPLRTRDVTDILVRRKGLDAEDKELIGRVRASVDGALRSMKKRNHVGITDDWPARWFIVGDDPKPLRRRGAGPSTRSDLEPDV